MYPENYYTISKKWKDISFDKLDYNMTVLILKFFHVFDAFQEVSIWNEI